jgi:hypothetical protein
MHQEIEPPRGEPRSYCPQCEPETDPMGWVVQLQCSTHREAAEVGTGDAEANEQRLSQQYLSGGGEAGGEGNRLWCEFFHRKKVPPRAEPPKPEEKPAAEEHPHNPNDFADCW